MQNAFVFDSNKCTGCQACQIACTFENNLDPQIDWRHVGTFNEQNLPGISLSHMSLACNHCLDAPCMEYCPALAYSRDADTGAVLINQDSCIGCKYCTWVCPYDAPKFNQATGVVEKCTFCNHRLKEGQAPACVTACPTGALQIEELQSGDPIYGIPGFSEVGIKPAIRVIPLREKQNPLEMKPSVKMYSGHYGSSNNGLNGKINLKSEWTLVAFTIIFALLTGLIAASIFTSITINPFYFLGLGLTGMGLSTTHLGKISRVYRAVFNWRRSWLSREIIFISIFMGLSTLYLFLLPINILLGWSTAIAGFLGLLSMDNIYKVVQQVRRVNIHSAQAVFTGFLFAAIFLGNPFVLSLIVLVKGILYGYRKFKFKSERLSTRPMLSIFRLGLGLFIPAIFWILEPANFLFYGILFVLAGEIIDRCEFYLELDILTPEKQMAIDLNKQLSNR